MKFDNIFKKINFRINFLFILLTISFLIVFFRLFAIQIYQRENILKQGLKIKEKFLKVKIKRGEIKDRNSNLLATNLRKRTLIADPFLIHRKDPENKLKLKERTAFLLSEKLNIDYDEIIKKLSDEERRFEYIKRYIPQEIADKIEKQIKKEGFAGLFFIDEYKRYYPNNNLAAQILGYVDRDNRGIDGLEYYLDKYLRGNYLKINYLKELTGLIYTVKENKKQIVENPSQTSEAVLTIDRNIQFFLSEALEDAYNKYKANKAMGMVMDPNTGEIIAMASYPSFNPNRFWETETAERKNRCITDIFEPGSVMKIFGAAALLQENKISDEDIFLCNGYIYYPKAKHSIHCYANHGWLDFKSIIEKSCNIGMIKSIERLDDKTFYKYIRDFGFGNITLVDLPGEEKGILRKPRYWSVLSKASMSIGQSIAVTLIQLSTATSAIANGGKILKPYIVKYIKNNDTILKENKPAIVRHVISESTAKKVTRLLINVTEQGTGKKAHIKGYKVAGKTGTAQKANPKGGYYDDKFITSFVGFVPADNPKLVISIVVDDPSKAKKVYGGEVSAPIFKEVAVKSLNYLSSREK